MSKIKGKQLADASIDLEKLQGGNKYLPETATLGSEKAVEDITDNREFVTKEYVDKQVIGGVQVGSGIAIEDSKVVLDVRNYTDSDEINITTTNLMGMNLNAPNGAVTVSGTVITNTVDTNGVDIHLELDGTSVELAASNATDTEHATVNVDFKHVDINHQNGTGGEQIKLENGIHITTTGDGDVTVTGTSVKYAADYRDSYTDRSLVDKAYVTGMYSDSSSVVIDDSGTVSVRSPKSDQLNLTPLDVIGTTGYTGINISAKPTGIMFILLNGTISLVGDGDKTMPFFFSNDNGTTARKLVDIEAGDKLYYNPVIGGYDFDEGDDKISIMTI
jgi:hypothetical protein